jgi:hypothetical protein
MEMAAAVGMTLARTLAETGVLRLVETVPLALMENQAEQERQFMGIMVLTGSETKMELEVAVVDRGAIVGKGLKFTFAEIIWMETALDSYR